MSFFVPRRRAALAILASTFLASAGALHALQVRPPTGRFDALVLSDATSSLDVATTPIASLDATGRARSTWEGFRAAHGPQWSAYVDRRSGAPLLVSGQGIAWPVGKGATIDSLGASLRPFIAENRALLLADDAELVLDRDASGELNPDVWQIVFGRAIGGVPVAGERYIFTVGHGNLIAFGASRWSRIDAKPVPDIDAAEARGRLTSYMKLNANDVVSDVTTPGLALVAFSAGSSSARDASGRYAGPVGSGYASALVWRFALRVAGAPGTWVAQVDAHTGAIVSFEDDTRYSRVKGGIYPISDDQLCPDGCEQANYPMPFANITINAASQTATTLGVFNCTPSGATATTTLSGPYIRVVDNCGTVTQSTTCNTDVDLSGSDGIDCAVPPGASNGNTHSARSSFYHLNRIAEHARTWLPSRTWLTSQVVDNVNINSTCNAFWDGSGVNFFKSGGGCNNTGEIAGVFLHEWGHGLDQNDGGGFDNPSEAYADITAFMSTHVSCVGRGFFMSGNCSGYGDACTACSGIRDQDWAKHVSNTPATPSGFLTSNCSGGGGPCGKEVHCESYVGAETLWDLAVRDLPGGGLDLASSWQLADKLWYKSRLGSGGNAYNCALPNSDGCAASSWFAKLRTIDDDDGNLANGTPHAAAIFAAFDRHAIACGAASDATNQNSATCPVIAAPTLSATAGSGTAALAWTPVANTIGTRIFRNDAGCQAATTRLSISTGSSFNDTGLVNGFTLYYSLQGIAANGACDGPVSNCVEVTPQSAAGTIKLDALDYACEGQVVVTVTDSNLGAATTTVNMSSTTEPAVETITLSRVAPGSATYSGSIALTPNPPVHDGVLSVATGATITARYVDANDGAGHLNQQRVTTASATCVVLGQAKPVADGAFGAAMTGSRLDGFGSSIGLTWDVATCASTDHHVIYGSLSSVASMTVLGGACDLGATGTATWSSVPAGDLWFIIVGDDDGATEGSWGTDGNGGQRSAGTPSGVCGIASRDDAATCP
jgi:hypothetical protein